MNDILLPARIRNEFSSGGLNQNFLLEGFPGTGKTTLAKILAKDRPTLYINVSDESSVDIIRTKITDFCSTISVMDNKEAMKVVLLDEMDGASAQFYKALRATIEKFAHSARFIGTCNYINKIPDPIISRFSVVSFNSISREEDKEIKISTIKRIYQIAKQIGIDFDQKAVVEFVKRNYPDMRAMMNKLQSFHDRGIKRIDVKDIKELNYTYNDLFSLILNEVDSQKIYEHVMSNYSTKTDEVLAALGSEFPTYVREMAKDKVKFIPQLVIANAEYQAMRVHVIDPVISMLACAYKYSIILNG
jgi:replication factor C small subunit